MDKKFAIFLLCILFVIMITINMFPWIDTIARKEVCRIDSRHLNFTESLDSSRPYTVYAGSAGRLGNIMFQTAALYAISQRTRRRAVYSFHIDNSCLARDMFIHFPNYAFSIEVNIRDKRPDPGSVGMMFRHVDDLPVLKERESLTAQFPESDVHICCYFQSYDYWKDHVEDIKRLFTFSPKIQNQSKEILNSIKGGLFSKVSWKIVIGIHVRRGDYSRDTRIHLPSYAYIKNAMRYFINLYGQQTTFVIASDGLEWCKQYFRSDNVHFLSDQTPFEDMATLSQCDHAIITFGTFSDWVGYFVHWQGGTVVYHAKTTKIERKNNGKVYAQWIPMTDGVISGA